MAGYADKSFLKKFDVGVELCELRFSGIVAFDLDYRYRAYSPLIEELTGVKAHEALGEVAFSVFPYLKETGVGRVYDEILEGESGLMIGTAFYVQRTGRRGMLDVSYRPVRHAGEIVGGLFEVRDISRIFQQYVENESIPSSTEGLIFKEAFSIRLGKAIKQRRKLLGLSQEELANRCGLHRTYITDIERGCRNVASGNLVQIAEGLNQSLWALIGAAEHQFI